ncbi:hypothetical protein HR45_04600 [Shewanella mangrovi]|uniref:Uncharacterized protein n=1 Tax=Shewanella mangrovi TaxID=1515746 RepID=A0A094K205_9GAMM|nr:hypothetical protein [Shewanella mangrovi]KFZ38706.1 hypothetical protein HR45_04600 [Shewanella mangrovi]
MFWQMCFWLLAALIILPLPFKLYEYATGKDDSPRIVKIEEMTNALFLGIGLIAFYGFIHQQLFLSKTFWQAWLVIAVVWSILSLFWSPKLNYATQVLGKKGMYIGAIIGVIITLPLLIAVYLYAF